MAEKLSKEAWIGFVKKRALDVDDTPLVKALEKLDRSDAGAPRIAALEAVAEQLKKQVVELTKKKKELGDKPFGEAKDKLYELLELAEAQHKEARQAAAEEEADDPALLTTAMVPLVRQLQRGDVQMHALIALTSKKVALLILRKPVSISRRKLLADYLQESSGIKYIAAECAGSSGQLEFLLEASASGLSKRLRQAVLDQTGLRCKVFVQFGEETETAEEEEAQKEAQEGAAPQAQSTAPGAPPLPPPMPPPMPPGRPIGEAEFTTRLKALLPRIVAAAASKEGQAAKLLASEAGALVRSGDVAGAQAKLDLVDKLLARLAGGSSPSPTAPQSAPQPAPQQALPTLDPRILAGWRVARTRWQQASEMVDEQIDALRLAVLQHARKGDEFAEAMTEIADKGLNAITGDHRVKLAAALLEIGDGAGGKLQAHAAKARAQLQAFDRFLASSTQIAACELNPFEVEVSIRATLQPALNAMSKLLEQGA